MPPDKFVSRWVMCLDKLQESIEGAEVAGRPTEYRDGTVEAIPRHN